MLHLGFAVLVAFLGEIDFAALDEVGKHMFQLPFRFGGQNFHDISKEAPFCFLGNIAAHAHLVKEKLEKFDASLMEKLEQTLALSEDNYFHRGQTTTGRLPPNTNTAEGTLTQESGDVRSVEGEVCGAVLVDE